jgi:ribosomal protein S18 acetylase RimI-like enzyme
VTIIRPMRADSYAAYLEAAIVSYAQDNVEAGRWPEVRAVERSRADFESLLPQGLATPDNHLYEICASLDGEALGFVWLSIEQEHGAVLAYIYDLEIKPEFRRRGHAMRALQAVESIAAAAGATSIGLNVFASNTKAQALYQRLGYVPTTINMYKPLVLEVIEHAGTPDGS